MQTDLIDYKIGDCIMEGCIAYNPSTTPQPLILVVHDWTGNREFTQEKAKYFASQGFIGFAVDLYGKGKRGSDTDKTLNRKLVDELMQDRSVIVPRLQAAIECASNIAKVDAKRIIALGFCMGGLSVLDLARSGANVAGVVSVHGNLKPTETNQSNKVMAKIMVIHGHNDKGVPPQQVLAFENEMSERNADWQVHVFGNTYHSFTNPKANDPELSLYYSPVADARTWVLVRNFTDEIILSV